MVSKTSTTSIALLLYLLLSTFLVEAAAARPMPTAASTDQSGQAMIVDEERSENMGGVESCEGVGEEDCLVRRTLAAHLDYIYTQGRNNKP